MEKDSLLKRYLVFISGLYFLALGIVLIVKSSLGTTPISSLNYVMSINSPLTLGSWTFITNIIMICIQLWLVKDKYGTTKDRVEILLQLPLSFIFSAFIDFNMIITHNIYQDGYMKSLGILLVGCIIQAIGVVLEIKPKVAMMSAEGMVKYISKRCNKEFGKIKVYVDIALVAIAVGASLLLSGKIEGIREGTIIAAFITGHFVGFINNHVMTRKMIKKLKLTFIRIR